MTRTDGLTEADRSQRRAVLADVMASAEADGFVYSPAMRDLLDRDTRGLLTEAEFRDEVLALGTPQSGDRR